MEFETVVNRRRSIRKFKPDPIERKLIARVLTLAGRAPSAMNTQPWQFFVISGDPLEKIKQDNIAALRTGVPPKPEHALSGWSPDSVFRRRQVDLGKQLFTLMRIPRDDMAQRISWMERGYRYFDAPVAVIITYDAAFTPPGPLMDIGAVMQTLCLAATDAGLDTCIEDQGVHYPDIIRRHASVPESRVMATAVALGFPDPDFPANRVQSERESVENNTTWIGF
jgi:nitroreductase